MALSKREAFAQVMEHMCTHDGGGGHGYTQDARWGDGATEEITLSDGTKVTIANGDRDCSSGIISALQAVGIDTHGASYTGNMRQCLLASGWFEWYPMSSNHYAKRGDIYLNETHHTAMCTSDSPDMLAQFSINENGRAHGGRQGDQTGRESNIRSYYNYPWDGRLCWKQDGDESEAEPESAPAPEAGDTKIAVDGEWGKNTTRLLQETLGTVADSIVSNQRRKYKDNGTLMNCGYGSWEWTDHGYSDVIKALQKKLGCDEIDGVAGPNTVYDLQGYLGVSQDRECGPDTVKALQARLNGGTF